MTPHEISLIVDVYSEKMKADQEEKLTLAYMSAYWQRVENLDPLDKILGKIKEKEEKQMSDMEMLINVRQLNAMFGGSVE